MTVIEKEKRSILHISGVGIGGIETLVTRIIRDLKSDKLDFEMYSIPTEETNNKDILEDIGVKINYVDNRKKFSNIIYMYDLYKLLKKNKYHVVHSHNLFSSGINMLIAWLARVPIRIAHAHNTQSNKQENLFRLIYIYIMRSLINTFATDLIAVSEESANYVFGRKSLLDKRLKIIYNGIDLKKFNKKIYDNGKIIKELNINSSDINFICIARFAIQKNHKFLIDVFNEILKVHKESKLILVGDGDTRKDIERYVEIKGIENNVIFTGNRDDIPEILNVMDYFILPSMWEGFGIVYIEAQAMGLHCFASDCIPKAADAGNISFISLEKDPCEWSEEILKTHYKINKQKLFDDSLKSKFDINIMIRRISEIYER